MLERMSFSFVEFYLATKSTLEFGCPAVCRLDWVLCTWDTGEVYSMEEHDYACWKNQKDVTVIYEEVLVPVVPRGFTHKDAEVEYRYYRWSPESAALSRQSSDFSAAPSGFEDDCGGNSDDDWDVGANDGGATTSDC